MNHLTLRIYGNGEYVFNVVKDEDLENHIWYNETFRLGNLLYVDGKRVYDGYRCGVRSPLVLERYDKIAEDFFKNNNVDMSKPTIPYR